MTGVPSSRDKQRQNRSEAAVDELQSEDDRHQQDEVLERQHAAERDASIALDVVDVRGLLFVVHEDDEKHGDEVEERGDEKRISQADELRDDATDDRADRRPEPLRGLHEADGIRHPVARRRVGRHRQGQRTVSGEEALQARASANTCHGRCT